MTEDTLLYRQINPSWIQLGRVTSQAFRPTPKDQALLSVYDGDQISAEGAWRHFTAAGFGSVGVLAVEVNECIGLGLEARPDPAPFPEHAVIDFAGLTDSEIKAAAKRLRAEATARGWCYQP